MNEGASPCAGGIEGACDVVYLPDYLWPGVILIFISLIVILCFRKKLSKNLLMAALVIWLFILVGFTTSIFINTETAGDRSAKGRETCRKLEEANHPQAGLCEW